MYDNLGFSTINIHFNVIYAVKGNGFGPDMLYDFNLIE